MKNNIMMKPQRISFFARVSIFFSLVIFTLTSCEIPGSSNSFSESLPSSSYDSSSESSSEILMRTVVFDSNGGTAVDSQQVADGGFLGKPSDPAKEGYSFDEWYTTNAFAVVWNFENDRVLSDLTLYGNWLANEYTVTFFTNGGTGEQSITAPAGSPNMYTPVKTGYDFEGWYLDPEFTNLYGSDLFPTKDLSLFAKWSVQYFSITYELNGGSNSENNVFSFSIESADIILHSPSKIGNTFGGWYSNETFSGNALTVIPSGSIGSMILYAQWIPYIYTIFFVENGGSEVEDITGEYDSIIVLPTPSKTGYTFGGWFHDNSTFTNPFSLSNMPLEGTTLFAKWTLTEYTITYNLDGGTNSAQNPLHFNFQSSSIFLYSPQKIGHAFEGWYGFQDYSGERITVINTGTSANIFLFAKWSVSAYAVFFQEISGFNSDIETGNRHNLVLTSTGRVFAWGENTFGKLGISTSVYFTPIPTDITATFSLNANDRIMALETGGEHSMALTLQGSVFTWGKNEQGQLGDNTTISQSKAKEITSSFVLAANDKVLALSAGYNFSMALTLSGRVFTWGSNYEGQLGYGPKSPVLLPMDITSQFNLSVEEKIISLYSGSYFAMALTSTGRVFAWGSNSAGQLGTGTEKSVPTEITSRFGLTAGESIVALELGSAHSMALSSTGKIFTWGMNSYGAMGDNTTVSKFYPINITSRFLLRIDEIIVSLSCGHSHSFATTSSGRVFAWGINDAYQLGDGTTTNRLVPTEITQNFSMNPNEKVSAISGGYRHSIALSTNGRVFSWGNDNRGALGNEYIPTSSTPNSLPQNLNFSSSITIQAFLFQANIDPLVPIEKDGYTFSGWFIDKNLSLPYVFETMPPNDLTLYGTFFLNYYSITYNLMGGSGELLPKTYSIETATFALSSPTKPGHTFLGWYDNPEYSGSSVTSIAEGSFGNKTFYAKWLVNQYTLTFDENGGPAILDITADFGSVIQAPPEPTREGYTFAGWYSDAIFTTTYIFTTMPSENATIYAKWNPRLITVAFELNGGTGLTEMVAYAGSTFTVVPTREGYVFVGWYTDFALTTPYESTSFPTQSMTLYAGWSPIS